MSTDGLLSTPELDVIFSREVAAMGGVVKDRYDDGRLLLVRGVLAESEEVRPLDKVFGGVALRSNGPTVFVHPYVFRQVCTNGSIMAQAVQTRTVNLGDFASESEAEGAVAEAVRACGAPEAFADLVDRVRTATERKADLALSLLPLIGSLPARDGRSAFRKILKRFLDDADDTHYGLFNAVTSVARDTPDPQTRWRLEEMGGGLIVGPPRAPVRDGSAARALAMA
jgi:hypothetical protein